MDVMILLRYGGIGLLCVLLFIFELKDRGNRKSSSRSQGYEYYTPDNNRVVIKKVIGSLYKVYIWGDNCPVQTKQDRFGSFFTIRARSAAEAECIIDELYMQRE